MNKSNGTTILQGEDIPLWSARANSSTTALSSVVYENITDPEHDDAKTYGLSVHCVISTRVNNILHQFPFSLPYSGYVDRTDGKVYDQGTRGYFWSAGSDSATHARDLLIYGNYTNPEDSSYKTNGFSVRCDQGSTRVNDILHQFPFSLPYSGYASRLYGSTVFQGTYGYFWSAGSDSATNARALYYYGNYTYPEHAAYKTSGFSVRYIVFCSTSLRPKPPLFSRL